MKPFKRWMVASAIVVAGCGGSLNPDGSATQDAVIESHAESATDGTTNADGTASTDGTADTAGPDGSASDARPDVDAASALDGNSDAPRDSGDATQAADGGSPADVAADSGDRGGLVEDAASVDGPSVDAAQGDGSGPPADAAPGDRAPDGATGSLTIVVPVDRVPGDGWSMVPVIIRAAPGGALPTSELVFSLSRAAAGLLRPRFVPSGAAEPQTYFTPCDAAATSGCLGPVTIRVALSSAPDVILAESAPLTITDEPQVGTPAACNLAPNVLFLERTSSTFFGVSLATSGIFDSSGAARRRIHVGITPTGLTKPPYGQYWEMEIGTPTVNTDLTVGIFRRSADDPEMMTIIRDLGIGGCSSGAFQIRELVWAGNQLDSFVTTFDLSCGLASEHLRGCLRFTAP